MVKDFRKIVTAITPNKLQPISVKRTTRISPKSLSAAMSSLGNLKLGPFVGWSSGPEGIYWPTEGQAASSFTVGDKSSSIHRLLRPKRDRRIYIHRSILLDGTPAARLRTPPVTCSVSPETVFDSAVHSTELIQIPCGQYSLDGFLTIRWILHKRTAEEHRQAVRVDMIPVWCWRTVNYQG